MKSVYFDCLARLGADGRMTKNFTDIDDDIRDELLKELQVHLNKMNSLDSVCVFKFKRSYREAELQGTCKDLKTNLGKLGWIRTNHSGHNEMYARRKGEWPLLALWDGGFDYRLFLRGEFIHD